MPTLKVKTEYVDKLKALGVYDAWLTNVKSDYNDNLDFWINGMECAISWKWFIETSFSWNLAPEGFDYWENIGNS